MTTSLALSDQKFIIAAFLELIAAVKKQGIKIDLKDENDSRAEALAFALESIFVMYADADWRLLINDLIKKISSVNGANEASWVLEQEVEALFKARIAVLMVQADVERRKCIQALSDLFMAAKKRNLEQHQKGLTVHFGGIPRDLVPAWYRDKLHRHP